MISVKGNGQIVSNTYSVSSFLHLHLSVNGRVELCQSTEEKVEVETDENLLSFIEVVNSGRTLFVTSDAGYHKLEDANIVVRVFFRQLTKLNIRCERGEVVCNNLISLGSPAEIKIQGAGNNMLNLDVPALKLLIQNNGDVTLTGKCGDVEIKTQSDGNLFAKEFIAQRLMLKNMSAGIVEVKAEETIAIMQYGEGYVHYYGSAILRDVNQRGAGEIKHVNQ